MKGISHCVECRRPLRAVTLFCSGCHQAYCGWSCYIAHRRSEGGPSGQAASAGSQAAVVSPPSSVSTSPLM